MNKLLSDSTRGPWYNPYMLLRTYKMRIGIISTISFLLLILSAYGAYRYHKIVTTLNAKQVTIANLQSSIQELQGNLSLSQYERDRLTTVLTTSQERAGALAAQTNTLSDTVDTLTKLTTLDPELLKKYSKVYFLNEHYVPSSLIDIPAEYARGTDRKLQFHGSAWSDMKAMLDDSNAEGLNLRIASAYRSYGTQTTLKAAYKVTYGTTAANKFSAEQGYSEHQLGTTADLTTAKTGSLTTAFDTTPEFKWLSAHAYEYGFILSYPKNNNYYVYEPWHWRFVGKALAATLHEENTYMYALEQRDIDTYLLHIFD